MAADDYAIVVGIDDYARLKPLHGCERDAAAMHAWLVDPAGGAVPAKQTRLILSSDYDPDDDAEFRRPWVEDVRTRLEWLCNKGGPNCRLGRRLYLYLAGHGCAPGVDDAALIMANASLDVLHSMPATSYADHFRRSTLFDEVVLFMDVCRDHYANLPQLVVTLPDIAVTGADPAYLYGLATKWSAQAREAPDPEGAVRGRFTTALLEALAQPGADSTTVEGYVTTRLVDLAPPDQYQAPVFVPSATPNTKSIVFNTNAPATLTGPGAVAAADAPCRLRVRFTAELPRVEVTLWQDDQVAETRMAGGPWEWPLVAGRLYELRRSDQPGDSRFFRAAGEVVDVQL